MTANVFISHSDEDIARCAPLLKTLGAWQIPCYFDATDRRSGQGMAPEAQQALVQSDVMLRICTRYTNSSYWMSIEAGALLSLQADDYRAGQAGRHRLVNLILDTRYRPEPFDVNATNVNATNVNATNVNATNASASGWANELRSALDLPPLSETASVAQAINPPPARKLSRRAAIGLGVGGVALVAAGAAGALWLERHNGGAKPAGPPSPDASLRWWFLAADAPSLTTGAITAAPLADANAVYIATRLGRILALSHAGKQLWRYDLPAGAGVTQTPALGAGVLYFSATNSGVYAIQAGKKRWFQATEGVTTTDVVLGGSTLYVNTAVVGSFLTLYAAASGATIQDLTVTPFTVPTSGVALADGLLICGGEDGYLYALDPTDPQSPERWRADVGATRQADENAANGYFVNELPVVANGVVYAGSIDFNLYALDAQTGARRWAYSTQGEINATSPAVADGVVYVVSEDTYLYAVDAQTGTLRWRFQTNSARASTPTVAQGIVYVSSSANAVYALDAQTGALRHTYKTAAGVRAQPTVVGDMLYVADSSGYVYGFALGG